MLRGDDHGFDPLGNSAVVLHRDLGFAVRAQVLEHLLGADVAQAAGQLVGQHDGQGHQLLGLAAGVAEHEALVSRALLGSFLAPGFARPGALLVALGFVDALGDVGRLLVDAGQDAAGFVVEAVMGAGVADLADRVADDLLEIGVALRGDLAGDEHHAGRGYRLAGDAALGVLGQQGVEDGV